VRGLRARARRAADHRPARRRRPRDGHRPAIVASTATTDARSFHLYGGPPAVCFGPLAESEHGFDERVHLPSITQTAQTIALFIADWCGLAPAPSA
jgi:acetylornithine deacetylase